MATRTKRRGIFESSNPYLNEETFQERSQTIAYEQEERMTGAVNKTFLLGVILLSAAAVSFTFPNPILTWGGAIGGLIVVFMTTRNVEKAATYAPIYAVLEGMREAGLKTGDFELVE